MFHFSYLPEQFIEFGCVFQMPAAVAER